MELGNLIYGNSRGAHEVDRGLQDQWCEWMEKLGFDSTGHFDDGEVISWGFENDVFKIQPYYWGDCDCGYDEKEYEWSQRNQHREACYQTEYAQISATHSFFSEERKALVQALCEKHELSYPWGSAVHCTCDYQDKWNKWSAENSHKDDCSLIQPNFLFKPTGFRLDWYKYPLRDSYSSEVLTKELMDEMFAECERSMK